MDAKLVMTFTEEPTPAQLELAERLAEEYERENPTEKVCIGLPKPRGTGQ